MTEYCEEKFCMAWRSLSGIQNDGIVSFSPTDDDKCICTLTQNIDVPRLLYKVMPAARLERYIQESVLKESLVIFNDIVEKETT